MIEYDSGNKVDAPDRVMTIGVLGWVWIRGQNSRLD